jgi:hypothetical protein
MSLVANFRKSIHSRSALSSEPGLGPAPSIPQRLRAKSANGTRMAILEIDLRLYSLCLTLLRDTAYSFVEGIFHPCADGPGVARG